MRERGGVRMRDIIDGIAFVAVVGLILVIMLAMPDAW
jgi:hypothetical protein